MNKKMLMCFFLCCIVVISGCATFRRADQASILEMENRDLRKKIKQLEQSKKEEVSRVVQTKEKELSDLDAAKRVLEEQLKKEIGEYKAKLQMTERGLVITFVAEIFFNSGKDVVRQEGQVSLDKVAQVLNNNVPESYIAVEGHTDSDPIKHSGWESNWELSTARALAVVHCFIEQCKVKPERLSAVGYGEYRPVASNDLAVGKQKNRRVEIVILPSQVKKVKSE